MDKKTNSSCNQVRCWKANISGQPHICTFSHTNLSHHSCMGSHVNLMHVHFMIAGIRNWFSLCQKQQPHEYPIRPSHSPGRGYPANGNNRDYTGRCPDWRHEGNSTIHGNNVLYIFSDLLGENESALIKFAYICRWVAVANYFTT